MKSKNINLNVKPLLIGTRRLWKKESTEVGSLPPIGRYILRQWLLLAIALVSSAMIFEEYDIFEINEEGFGLRRLSVWGLKNTIEKRLPISEFGRLDISNGIARSWSYAEVRIWDSRGKLFYKLLFTDKPGRKVYDVKNAISQRRRYVFRQNTACLSVVLSIISWTVLFLKVMLHWRELMVSRDE